MKSVFFLTPLALAAIAGCAPAPSQIQHGQWELVSELRSIDMPGAAPEILQQARSEIGRRNTGPRCFTEDQARDFLGQTVKRGLPPSCTFSDERYANGQIHLRVSCQGPAGTPPATILMEGNFSRTTINTQVTMERPGPNGQSVRSTELIRGRRIGDCTASPEPAMPEGAVPVPAPAPAPTPAQPGNSAQARPGQPTGR